MTKRGNYSPAGYPECKNLQCFANIPINANTNDGLCTILTECLYPDCPFFKTRKQLEEERSHGSKKSSV